MAQPIQVPQDVPNAPQTVNPFPLVDSYLNRKQNQQQMLNSAIGGLGDTYLTLRQQKIQNQMNALGAYAQIAGAVGPDAANQVTGSIPNMPSWNPGQGQTPTAPPQTPMAAQQNIAPAPQAPQTAGVGGVSDNPSQVMSQDQSPSPFIHASVSAGHPDMTGHVGRFQAPPINDLSSQIGANNAQMLNYQNKGAWGAGQQKQIGELNAGLKAQADMSIMPLTVAEKEAQIRAANSKFATPDQGSAIAQGDPNAIAGAYGGSAPIEAYNNAAQKQMEVKKTVAGEISKQGQSSQQIGQIRQLYTDLQDALGKNTPGIMSTVAGKVNQATGGRMGSSAASDVLNAANPLATALNTELSRRFNSGEVELLSKALIPQPMDTPQYAASKMQRLNHMIQSMESGNEQNVMNVANAITGGKINSTIMPTRSNIANGQSSKPSPKLKSTQIPDGRVTVVSPTGQVGHIPQSQLKEALASGYKEQ